MSQDNLPPEAFMPSIIRHTRQTTIIDDRVHGIIQIRDERLTIHTVYPDELDLTEEEDDDPPPSWGDRFRYPPPSSN